MVVGISNTGLEWHLMWTVSRVAGSRGCELGNRSGTGAGRLRKTGLTDTEVTVAVPAAADD